MGDGGLNLHLHLVIHVSLCLATAAIHDQHVDKDEQYDNTNDQDHRDALSIINDSLLNSLLQVERLEALVRRRGETSTNCIENTHGLNLSAVCLLIDHDGGVDVCSIFLPVRDLFIDISVLG